MPIPWSERINALSINPVSAQPADVARMSADLSLAHTLLAMWWSWAEVNHSEKPLSMRRVAFETREFLSKMTLP